MERKEKGIDITSYLLGKKAGGGGTPPVYEEKNVSITQNGDSTITADSGYDAISKVNLSVNVPQPSGKITITQNGTNIDVSSYASADVNVSSASWQVPNGTKFSNSTWATAPTLDTSACTNMSSMFSNCYSLTTVSILNTSNATNLSSLFSYDTALTTLPATLDTSKCTDMSNMFQSCTNLTTVPTLNTSRCTNMSNMFASCSKITTIPVNDVHLITNFSGAFSGCSGLTGTIDFSNYSFSTTITNVGSMFSNCANIENVNLSTLGITANNVSLSSMFSNCSKLKTINLSNFAPRSINSASSMFQNCTALEELDISSMTMPNAWFSNMFTGVPANCLIYVKDQTAKNWFTTNWSSLTNVQIKGA